MSPTRIVTGLIRAPNGEPWPQFTLAFTVSPSTYRPDAHYPHKTVRVTTAEDGTFEAELVTNVRYLLDLESAFVRRGSSTGYPGESKNIPLVVPDGDGPISLEELRGLDGIDPDVPDVKALIEQIIADYLDEHGGMVPHTHPIGEVEGLDDALAGKADTDSLADVATSGRYDDLADVPTVFPPSPHTHDDAYTPLEHATDTTNPHGVTAAQIGAYTAAETDSLLAGKVDTASLANVATTGSYDDLADVPGAFPPEPHNHDSEYAPLSHASDTDNPHNVTAGQVGAYTKAEVDAAIEDSGGFPGFDGTGTASTAARSDHHHDGAYSPVGHDHDARYVQPGQLGSAALADAADFATVEQGAKADTAVQPVQLHQVATTGDYADLDNTPVLFDGDYNSLTNTPSIPDPADFASAAQGAKADTAVQPGDLHSVATSGDYGDLANTPTIPDAQVPADWTASTGVARILNKPALGTAAGADADDFAAASHSHGWDDVTGKPATFPPATHGHAIADVTSLQSALDGKAASSHTHTLTGSIQFTFNGGGAAIEAGAEALVRMNFAGTFTGWDIYGDQPGSFVGTVGRATHGDYPTFTAISGTSKPTLASTNKNQSTTLTGWTTAFSAGDVIRIVVDSAATVEQVAVSLRYTRTV